MSVDKSPRAGDDGDADPGPPVMSTGIAAGGAVDAPEGVPEEDALVRNERDIEMDGGWTAWTQVAASFLCYFNHLGLINSYGVFQPFYERHLLQSSSPSAISWIGSVQVFFLMALSCLLGPIYDAGHCRLLLLCGTVLVAAGFMLASVSTLYWHLLLSQGVCIGLGACALSVPSIAILPMYFRRRRARAMALATVGSGLGSTLYPLLFQSLQPRLGFPWAMRIMGFVSLATCLAAVALVRPVPVSAASSPWRKEGLSWRFFVDRTAFRETPFLLYCAAIFFENLTYFVPPYYMQSYARAHGMSGLALVNYLVPIANASSLPGRILPSLVADRLGSLDTFIFVLSLTAATNLYWISVTSPPGNIAFAVLYGFFGGGVLSLLSVVLTRVTPDMRRMGTRLGMVSVLKGVASLIGPPISGAILDATGSYLGVQLFAAMGMMMCAVLCLVLRLREVRRSVKAARRKDVAEGMEMQIEGHGVPET